MKKLTVLCLILCTLLSLTGCAFFSDNQAPVNFYYRSRDYLHPKDGKVIEAEERDASGHINDLDHLLRLYLMGPYDEELVSPFPKSLQVTDIYPGADTVILVLTNDLNTLQGADRSIACACLALTCMDITGAESVTLIWENEILTLDASSLMLYDNTQQQTE